jgi:hypothetical protein
VIYLVNLNISNAQIADNLEISESTVQQMCSVIRGGVVKKPDLHETYIIAGHKGQPDKVKLAGRLPHRRRLKGKRGRGTSAKVPISPLRRRGGRG